MHNNNSNNQLWCHFNKATFCVPINVCQVNNCVGLGNHKFFLLFIGYIFVISVYALILILARFFSCLGGSNGCMASGGDAGTALQLWAPCCCVPTKVLLLTAPSHPTTAPVLIVIVVVLALLFGLFTFCMACDQMSVVLSNATGLLAPVHRCIFTCSRCLTTMWCCLANSD